MTPHAELETPDLLRYSRRLGGIVTVLAALAVTAVASHVVRSAVIQTGVDQELAKADFLRDLYPLPADRLTSRASIEPLLGALRRWVERAGWSGALYVGRFDAGPQWVPAAGTRVPASRITDLSWFDRPGLVEPAPAASGDADRTPRLLTCRVDLSERLTHPEYLIIFRPAGDIDRRLRSLYALIFFTISGTMGLLFAALISVVARGEKLRRVALDGADALRHKNEEAQAMLLQAAKMTALGELAAGIGHEINNPVAMVSNAVEILADHPTTADPHVRQGLEDIREAADRIRNIVRNLSSFSAPQVADFAPVDLAPLLARTVELARLSIQAHESIRLVMRLPADLPPVRAQDTALEQVFLNLLNNARYAVTRGGRPPGTLPEITLSACLVDATPVPVVRVEVRDNGSGIAPEHLPRLFEPFFTTKARWEGTGLGLWVSHRIVEGHSGKIRLESRPGAGAMFVVDLPVAVPGEPGSAVRKGALDA